MSRSARHHHKPRGAFEHAEYVPLVKNTDEPSAESVATVRVYKRIREGNKHAKQFTDNVERVVSGNKKGQIEGDYEAVPHTEMELEVVSGIKFAQANLAEDYIPRVDQMKKVALLLNFALENLYANSPSQRIFGLGEVGVDESESSLVVAPSNAPINTLDEKTPTVEQMVCGRAIREALPGHVKIDSSKIYGDTQGIIIGRSDGNVPESDLWVIQNDIERVKPHPAEFEMDTVVELHNGKGRVDEFLVAA